MFSEKIGRANWRTLLRNKWGTLARNTGVLSSEYLTETWIDFNFFGNQLSAHISDNFPPLDYCGKVDGIDVPIPHFGCLIEADMFQAIAQKLKNENNEFLVKPVARYNGKVGEQLTMFVFDLSGNALEFKVFSNNEEVFWDN